MIHNYMIRMMERLIEMLTSVIGWIVIALCQFLVIEGVRPGLSILGIVVVIDYVFGTCASWRERKTSIALPAPFFIESRKIRKSLLKAVVYMLFIFMSWVMWFLFFDAPVRLPVSTHDTNVISITIGICIAIEFWSILENAKRMGFDLIGRIVKTFKEFWKGYDEIKHR